MAWIHGHCTDTHGSDIHAASRTKSVQTIHMGIVPLCERCILSPPRLVAPSLSPGAMYLPVAEVAGAELAVSDGSVPAVDLIKEIMKYNEAFLFLGYAEDFLLLDCALPPPSPFLPSPQLSHGLKKLLLSRLEQG